MQAVDDRLCVDLILESFVDLGDLLAVVYVLILATRLTRGDLPKSLIQGASLLLHRFFLIFRYR